MAWFQQMHSQAAPEQGHRGGPLMVRQRFQGTELQQSLAAGRPGGVPELVEADLTAVGVAAAVGVQVAQGLADGDPLIPRRQLLQGPMGQLQIQQAGGALIGAGGLGGWADTAAAEQVGQARVVLPEAQDSHQPGRPTEEGVGVQAGPTEQQVVAAAGAFAAGAVLLPAAQPHRCARLLQELDPVGVVLPGVAHRQVDLQHPGIRRQSQHLPVAFAVHGQDPAQLRLSPASAVAGDHPQQLLHRPTGQRRQEQPPSVVIALQGEHLAQPPLREVLQRQAQSRRAAGGTQLPQGGFQGPGQRLPVPLEGEGHGPHLAIGLQRIPQLQGFQGAAQLLPDGHQQVLGLCGRGDRPTGGWLGGRPRPLGPGHQGMAIGPQDQTQGPAGVHLAVVALAGAVEQRAAGPGPLLQFPGEGPGVAQFGGAVGGHAPLGPFRVGRHQGWLTAHGETDSGPLQALFHGLGGDGWGGCRPESDRRGHHGGSSRPVIARFGRCGSTNGYRQGPMG